MKDRSTIWDFKIGDRFALQESLTTAEVVLPTEDGIGLVAKYLNGRLAGERDFVFSHEISEIVI